ncbi:MAG: phasin [Hyphomicrobiaceae bacterium]|nr:phasin [Hyphomicrobiaceae bacterium]
MNDFSRQTEDFLKAAKEARIPEPMKAMVAEGLVSSRKAFDVATAAARDNARHAETVLASVSTGAKSLNEKLIENTTANTEALFAAAQKIAKAQTLPEAAQLQAEFVKTQFTTAAAQTQEFFKLSAEISKSMFTEMQAATAKSLEQFRNVR